MALDNAFVTEVQQVALVVHDIDEALEAYSNRLGIGPWWVTLYAPPRLTDMRIRGEAASYSFKAAMARTGNTFWELIEPVDGPSIYKEFLAEHGEGQHHVLVEHEALEFEQAIATFTERGCPPLMEGRMGEVRFAYLDTEGALKTVMEVVYRPPDFVRPRRTTGIRRPRPSSGKDHRMDFSPAASSPASTSTLRVSTTAFCAFHIRASLGPTAGSRCRSSRSRIVTGHACCSCRATTVTSTKGRSHCVASRATSSRPRSGATSWSCRWRTTRRRGRGCGPLRSTGAI